MKKLLLILITAVVGLVAHADKTIYYDNSATGFSPMKIYLIGPDQAKDMTLVSGSIYKYPVPDDATDVLFYTGSWSNGTQTVDLVASGLSLENGHMYKGNKVNNNKCSLVDMTPATVYFSYDCSGSWSHNQAVNAKTEGSALVWTKRITPSNSDVYMVINTKSVNNPSSNWDGLTKGQDCVYYIHNVSATDQDGNAKINANQEYVGQLQANGIGHCLHVTGCKTNASYDLKLTFDNGAFSIKAEEVSGDEPGPLPEDDEYYVYFVNNNNWGSVNIWAWNSNHNHLTVATSWPGDQMELVSGNTYRWRLPEGNEVPSSVKFSNNGATATGDLKFVNHATYYPNGTIVEDVVGTPNIIYCHFKTDRMRRGNPDAPKCHVFKRGTNVMLHTFGSDDEKMIKIDDPAKPNTPGALTDRYEIWKYVIPMDKFQSEGYDCVTFYTNNDNQWTIDEKLGANRNDYLKKNWTKYIYATASADGGTYAVPTYVTPSEFLTLHNKNVAAMGREEIFIVGPNDSSKGESNNFKWYDESGAQHNFNNYDLLNCDRLTPDDGVFYLKVMPGANSYDDSGECVGNKFKLSWINVADHRATAVKREGGESSVNGALDNGRKWATFDLGTIGIDKDLAGSNYDENKGPAGRTKFDLNKSLKYTYYNCCDWIIWEQRGNAPRWIILDTHYDHDDANYQCESVTITDFDPHPSMKAEFKEFKTDGELPSGAPAHPHLYGHTANGHVDLKCNSASAQATINASTTNSNFTRNYEVEFNGENVANVPGNVTSFRYDYFPVDISSGALKIRARYTDNNTGLKFHSRTGDTTIDGLTYESNEPDEITVSGKYIEEELQYAYKKDKDGKDLIVDGKKVLDYCKRKFGVFVPDFNINIKSSYEFGNTTGELGAYADYRVFDENGNEITDNCKLYTDGVGTDLMKQRLVDNKLSDTPWNHNNHWAKSLKEETAQAPLYFEAEAISDYVKDVDELGTRTYTIVLQAVYPLVYQKNFAPVASTSSVNGELVPVAKTAATPVYDTKHVRKTRTVQVTVSPGNTVTGVDEVFGDAEADNADAPAEYYTISGVRVSGDLAPGIYVVRRGNKVTKEVVK